MPPPHPTNAHGHEYVTVTRRSTRRSSAFVAEFRPSTDMPELFIPKRHRPPLRHHSGGFRGHRLVVPVSARNTSKYSGLSRSTAHQEPRAAYSQTAHISCSLLILPLSYSETPFNRLAPLVADDKCLCGVTSRLEKVAMQLIHPSVAAIIAFLRTCHWIPRGRDSRRPVSRRDVQPTVMVKQEPRSSRECIWDLPGPRRRPPNKPLFLRRGAYNTHKTSPTACRSYGLRRRKSGYWASLHATATSHSHAWPNARRDRAVAALDLSMWVLLGGGIQRPRRAAQPCRKLAILQENCLDTLNWYTSHAQSCYDLRM